MCTANFYGWLIQFCCYFMEVRVSTNGSRLKQNRLIIIQHHSSHRTVQLDYVQITILQNDLFKIVSQ